MSMQVVSTSSSSRTHSCKSPGIMVSPSLSSSSMSFPSSNVSYCAGQTAPDWSRVLYVAKVGLDCPSDDEGSQGTRSRSLELQARPGTAGVEDTGSFMCTEANTRLSSAEILSHGKVSSGHHMLDPLDPVVTMSTSTQLNLPSCSWNRLSYVAIGSSSIVAEESSRKKVWRSSFLRAESYSTKGDVCNTFITLSRLALFRHSSAVAKGTSPGSGWSCSASMVMYDNRAGPVNAETSLTAKLYYTFKFSPKTPHSDFIKERFPLGGVSVPGRYVSAVASKRPWPCGCWNGVQTPMPPSLRRWPKLKVSLSCERVPPRRDWRKQGCTTSSSAFPLRMCGSVGSDTWCLLDIADISHDGGWGFLIGKKKERVPEDSDDNHVQWAKLSQFRATRGFRVLLEPRKARFDRLFFGEHTVAEHWKAFWNEFVARGDSRQEGKHGTERFDTFSCLASAAVHGNEAAATSGSPGGRHASGGESRWSNLPPKIYAGRFLLMALRALCTHWKVTWHTVWKAGSSITSNPTTFAIAACVFVAASLAWALETWFTRHRWWKQPCTKRQWRTLCIGNFLTGLSVWGTERWIPASSTPSASESDNGLWASCGSERSVIAQFYYRTRTATQKTSVIL